MELGLRAHYREHAQTQTSRGSSCCPWRQICPTWVSIFVTLLFRSGHCRTAFESPLTFLFPLQVALREPLLKLIHPLSIEACNEKMKDDNVETVLGELCSANAGKVIERMKVFAHEMCRNQPWAIAVGFL